MNNINQKWPYDEIYYQYLSKKYFLEAILKNSISINVRDQISFEKNLTLIFFCSPMYSNFYRLLTENSSDILNIFLLNEFKKKKDKIKKKILQIGIFFKKILYEFNFKCIYLSKNTIYFFTRMYMFEKYQCEILQKNFKTFKSDLYFWEYIPLSKIILLESAGIFFGIIDNISNLMSEWLYIYKKLSRFTNYKYKLSLHILSFILYQKNLNNLYIFKLKKNNTKKNFFFPLIDLLDGSLLEKVFCFYKISLISSILDSKTKILITNKFLIISRYKVHLTGNIQQDKIADYYSTIIDSFILQNSNEYECNGNIIKDYLNIISFSFSYYLYEKVYFFRRKAVDFFYENNSFIYNNNKNYQSILNLNIFKKKKKKNFLIKNYSVCFTLKESLLIFFFLNFSILILYKKKTNLFMWINFIKHIIYFNYYSVEYYFAVLIFIIFPKFQKKIKEFYLGIYLEVFFNFFCRINNMDLFENLYSTQNFLNLELNNVKIKNLIANYYLLFGHFYETKYLKKLIKQQILYTRKYDLSFTQINHEKLIRRHLDLVGTENIEKIFKMLGKLNKNPKYFELITELNKSKISESKYLIGLVMMSKKKINNAKKQFFISVSFNPRNLNGWLYLGYTALILEDFSLCFRSYNKIISEEPSNNSAWVNLSLLLFYKFKNKMEAYKSIKEAIKIKNTSLTVIKIFLNCSLDRIMFSWKNMLDGVLITVNSVNITECLKFKILLQIISILGEFISKKYKYFKVLDKKIKILKIFFLNIRKKKNFFKFFFNFHEFFGNLHFKITKNLKNFYHYKFFMVKSIYLFKIKYIFLNLTLDMTTKFFVANFNS